MKKPLSCHAALSAVVNRAQTFDSKTTVIGFIQGIRDEMEHDRLKVADVSTHLGVQTERHASPLHSNDGGTQVTYHHGDFESSKKSYTTEDYEILDDRLSQILRLLDDPLTIEKVKYFKLEQRADELTTNKSLQDFLEKGIKPDIWNLNREQELATRKKFMKACIGINAFVGLLAGRPFSAYPHAEAISELKARVLDTTVIDEAAHLELLGVILEGNPDKAKWIQEHRLQLSQLSSQAPYYNRLHAYEKLKGTSKDLFLLEALALATLTKGFPDIGPFKELRLAKKQDDFQKFGHLSSVGLLSPDELRIMDEHDGGWIRQEFIFNSVLKPGLGIALGGTAGYFACQRLGKAIGIPGLRAPKEFPLPPVLGKLREPFQNTARSFGSEKVLMDAQTPEGNYSLILLKRVDTVNSGSVFQVEGLTLKLNEKKDAAEETAAEKPFFFDNYKLKSEFTSLFDSGLSKRIEGKSFTSLLSAGSLYKPKPSYDPGPELAASHDRLLTHRFTLSVGEEFKPQLEELAKYFNDAKALRLSKEEVAQFVAVSFRIHTFENLRLLRWVLKDIEAGRTRKTAELNKQLLESMTKFREKTELDPIHVPKVVDDSSPERILFKIRVKWDLTTYQARKELYYYKDADLLPQRAEVERAIQEDFDIAKRLNLTPSEFKQLDRVITEIAANSLIWSLEGAENWLREELEGIQSFRRFKIDSLAEEKEDPNEIVFPARSWKGCQRALYPRGVFPETHYQNWGSF